MAIAHEIPRVGVGVFLRMNDRILLIQRKGAHGAGSYSIPGGAIEHGETAREAAVREVTEEVGITTWADHLMVPSVQWTETVIEGQHWITLYFHAEYFLIPEGGPRVCEPDKCNHVAWYSFSALPNPLFPPLQLALDKGVASKWE